MDILYRERARTYVRNHQLVVVAVAVVSIELAIEGHPHRPDI